MLDDNTPGCLFFSPSGKKECSKCGADIPISESALLFATSSLVLKDTSGQTAPQQCAVQDDL